jgi:two-component system LytT family sensor kinase
MNRFLVIAIHIGYWSLYILLLVVMFLFVSISQSELIANFSNEVWRWLKIMIPLAIVPGVIGFYSGYVWLFPRFIARKKIGSFFLFAGLTLIAASLIAGLVISVLFPYNEVRVMTRDGIAAMSIIMCIMSAINLVIGIVIKGFITSYNDIQLKEELTRQNTTVELALVKSQINPHFLFNTLNNIDVLIQRSPEDASNYLNKLSGILRFMLYEAKDEPMPFAVELENIQRYIELQRIRTKIENYVVVHIDGKYENLMLEPMLFLPIIENAFKYAEHKKEQEAIRIEWTIMPDQILFRCENSFSKDMSAHHAAADGGIGNGLIKKRIQLLYPGKHTFTTQEIDERFRVELCIDRA